MWFWIVACTIIPPSAVSPPDEARGIPLDTRVAVQGHPVTGLRVDGGAAVPADVQRLDLDWVVLTPREPLRPSIGYVVVGTGLHFHTAERLAEVPGPVQLHRASVKLVHTESSDCGDSYGLIDLDFTASSTDILFHEIAYTINDGPVVIAREAPPFDGRTYGHDINSSFRAGDRWCMRMRSVGLGGDISEQSDVACAIVIDCEVDDGIQCGGCSAGGSPSNTLAGMIVALLIAAGSSRRWWRVRGAGRRRW